jgi:hypothetical protein
MLYPPPEGTVYHVYKDKLYEVGFVVFNMVLEDGGQEVDCFYRSCLSIEEFQGMIL